MSRSVYYCRFTGDYARDTSHLSLIQHGAYTVLLDFYYSSGKPLPPDMNALCRICRAFDDAERDAVSQVVSQFFELRADGYHNKRADEEIAYRAAQRDKLSNAAKKTNEKRWGKQSSPSESLGDTPGGRIPSPSPSPQPKEKKNPAAKPAPPDPRHQPFFDFAFRNFQNKYMQPPSWGAVEGRALRDFLRSNPRLTCEELEKRYLAFLASTANFYRQQHGDLRIFLQKFDHFIQGPILEKGGSDGQLVTFAEKRSQKNADAIQRVLGRAEEASGDIRRALPPVNN